VCRGAETEASVFCFGGAVMCDVEFFFGVFWCNFYGGAILRAR